MPHFAYFISSHGFGHAARSAAVIAALGRWLPGSRFTLFTTVPAWFFEDSLQSTGLVVELRPASDLGLVQTDALTEDLEATLAALRERIPFRDAEVDALAREVDDLGADLVICDIAPLGLAVARRCGVPSLLIENFTWDWIYRGYVAECPGLGPIAGYLEEVFAGADHHVQAEPFCVPSPGARRVGPVSRAPRSRRADVRRRLGVPEDAPLAMITMGGIEWSYDALVSELRDDGDLWLVIPGSRRRESRGRLVRLPHRSEFFHPDLIHAADVVVGKLGYSTLAEVYRAGVPLGYLPRPRFPESEKLEAWVKEHLTCRRIEPAELQRPLGGIEGGEPQSSRWLEKVRELLRKPWSVPERADGAEDVAGFAAEIVRSA